MVLMPEYRNGSAETITSNSKKRVAIIGGGVSGILSIKACKEEEHFFEDIVCYEKTSDPGGLWKYRDLLNDINCNVPNSNNDIPTVMEGTVANSSKEMSAFSDYPPSPNTPNYMHHKVMLNYIQSYAKHFDCLKHIKLNHEIEEISQVNEKWKLSLIDHSRTSPVYRTEFFDIVMICTGPNIMEDLSNQSLLVNTILKNSLPRIILYYHLSWSNNSIANRKIIHTRNYKKPDKFKGEKVLVVGVGNSGLDVAVELSNVADEVYLSTRSGCWILPRAGFRGGRPYDTSFLRRSMHLMKDGVSSYIASYVMETLLNRRFDHELYGLRPAHPLFYEHPTVNDQLPSKIISGRVIVKGDVERLSERGVLFEGDHEKDEREIDSIILATGYHVDYPFLSKQLRSQIMDPTSNSVNLYKYIFPVNMTDDHDLNDNFKGIGFIGVPNALGPLFPIAEIQSRWFVQVAIGNSCLPTTSVMRRQLKVQEIQRKKKFTDTLRHGVQVEWIPYLDEISQEFGVKPNLWELFKSDPKLWAKLYFGPSVPYQYRLFGPHSWSDARETIMTVNQRIEAPFKTSRRSVKVGKDQVSVNNAYAEHNFIYKIIFAVIGAFLFDILFLYAP